MKICLIYSLISCFVDKTEVNSQTSAFFKYDKGAHCQVMEITPSELEDFQLSNGVKGFKNDNYMQRIQKSNIL